MGVKVRKTFGIRTNSLMPSPVRSEGVVIHGQAAEFLRYMPEMPDKILTVPKTRKK